MILSELKKALDKKFGDEWYTYEIETLSFELGALFDEKTVQKITVLMLAHTDPDILINDADYFLRFIEVANGHVVDAHYHDIPSSLEILYALQELKRILDEVPATPMLRNVTGYVINNEGHGEAFHPLLAEYSGKSLVKNEKTSAGNSYIIEMDKTKGEG